jgi:ABC-2 type transport system ATP-binding protein
MGCRTADTVVLFDGRLMGECDKCTLEGVVDFRLLGPVEVWTGPQRLDAGPRQQRLVLAILALRANQVVPVDQLIALTWAQAPPESARHSIQVRVSLLRALLADAGGDRDEVRIATRGSTYVLQTDPQRVDAHRFRILVNQAHAEHDDAAKAQLLRRALELWRGPPLADVATPHAEPLCHGLAEARMLALEDWAEAELQLGRHDTIIQELTEHAAEHPYRQRLLAQLMLALYRAGRASDALAAYRRTRHLLLEEFGGDPQPQLQRLVGAMLRGDPALDHPPTGRDRMTAAPVRRHRRRWRGRPRTIQSSDGRSADPAEPNPGDGER